MGDAVGMLEVFGLATAFAAADAGCKAGNVWLEKFDKNKPANADELPVPLIVMIEIPRKAYPMSRQRLRRQRRELRSLRAL